LPALAIDTATDVLALAISEHGGIVAESNLDAGRHHLELLLPKIQDLLQEYEKSITDIEAIAVGTGPGTFSGLRVGIATARALSQMLRVPLAGFNTLEAVALQLAGEDAIAATPMLLPIIDAKRGQIFTQLYRREGEDRVVPESEVLCISPEGLPAKLVQIAPGKVKAGGNGAVAYHDQLGASSHLVLLPADHPANRVRAIWHFQALSKDAIYQPRQLLEVLPLYVREPDADRTILLRKKEPWLK